MNNFYFWYQTRVKLPILDSFSHPWPLQILWHTRKHNTNVPFYLLTHFRIFVLFCFTLTCWHLLIERSVQWRHCFLFGRMTIRGMRHMQVQRECKWCSVNMPTSWISVSVRVWCPHRHFDNGPKQFTVNNHGCGHKHQASYLNENGDKAAHVWLNSSVGTRHVARTKTPNLQDSWATSSLCVCVCVQNPSVYFAWCTNNVMITPCLSGYLLSCHSLLTTHTLVPSFLLKHTSLVL